MLGKYTQGSSRFLKSEDLVTDYNGHAVLIQMVREELVKHRGGQEMGVLVTFAEYPEKVLELNVGNARKLEELFGQDCGPRELIGQVVWLYAEETDAPGKDGGPKTRTMGLRIRAIDDEANGLIPRSNAAVQATRQAPPPVVAQSGPPIGSYGSTARQREIELQTRLGRAPTVGERDANERAWQGDQSVSAHPRVPSSQPPAPHSAESILGPQEPHGFVDQDDPGPL